MSVAAFTSRGEKWVGEGRKETGRGVGGSEVARGRLNAMKLWSEVCRGFTKTLSATQLHG